MSAAAISAGVGRGSVEVAVADGRDALRGARVAPVALAADRGAAGRGSGAGPTAASAWARVWRRSSRSMRCSSEAESVLASGSCMRAQSSSRTSVPAHAARGRLESPLPRSAGQRSGCAPGATESHGTIRRFLLAPRLTAHVRHRTKYVDMPIAETHAFVFAEGGHPGPRARTLREFVGFLSLASCRASQWAPAPA